MNISTDDLVSRVGRYAYNLATTFYRVGIYTVGYTRYQMTAAIIQADTGIRTGSMQAGSIAPREIRQLHDAESFLRTVPLFVGDNPDFHLLAEMEERNCDVMIIVRKRGKEE